MTEQSAASEPRDLMAALRASLAHPAHCSCAVPCRTCGHESEQHAGSMWYGTGPRRCAVDGCTCRGCYIGSTPARCKQSPSGERRTS